MDIDITNTSFCNLLRSGNVLEASKQLRELLTPMWKEVHRNNKALDDSLEARFKAHEFKGIGKVDGEGTSTLVEIADDKGKAFDYRRVVSIKAVHDIDKLVENCQETVDGMIVSIQDVRYHLLKPLLEDMTCKMLARPVGVDKVYVFKSFEVFVRVEAFHLEMFLYATIGTETKRELFHEYISRGKALEIAEALVSAIDPATQNCTPDHRTEFINHYADMIQEHIPQQKEYYK